MRDRVVSAGPRTRLTASAADLPEAVADALASPAAGREGEVEVGGVRWATLEWGPADGPPLLLLHGVTSNAGVWWRVGPALAAAGRHVVALDMPGHGRTQAWSGRHRWIETATDVAGFIRGAGLDRPDLAVIGHSWGGMVTAHLPLAGIRPEVLVLLDPPVLTLDQLEQLTHDPTERRYDTLQQAVAAVRLAYPDWSEGDVQAKAQALTEFNVEAVLAVLLQNGEYDGGMAALRRPEAAGTPIWLVRGEWDAGCMVPDSSLPAIEARIGRDHVITIRDGPHSPQRTHPEATVLALLRAIDARA